MAQAAVGPRTLARPAADNFLSSPPNHPEETVHKTKSRSTTRCQPMDSRGCSAGSSDDHTRNGAPGGWCGTPRTPSPGEQPMKKHLFVVLACAFVVMIGFGITRPVLPFYVTRLALAAGASPPWIVLHVTLLTGVYAVGGRTVYLADERAICADRRIAGRGRPVDWLEGDA